MFHVTSKRKLYVVAVIFALLFLSLATVPAQAQNYPLKSLCSINKALGSGFAPSRPSINNFGDVVYHRVVFDPAGSRVVIMLHDGTSETEFFDISETFGGGGVNVGLVINDNVAVAAKVDSPSSTSPCRNVASCIVRINSDKSVTVLATADFGEPPADFVEFDQVLSFNNAGQVAIGVRNNDGSNAIVRIDDTGFTEIARVSATVVGVQGGVEVYHETRAVSAPLGGQSMTTFPSFMPSMTGEIEWTATLEDGNADDDTATDVSMVLP